MPTLVVDNFNIVCACVGGFISIFGLVSYLLKEQFYLSEALISTIAGIILSPHATNFIRPLEYANNDALDLEKVTLYFTRLVLGVQLVLAGVQLPSKYLRREWKHLAVLLGPGMCFMWLSTSLLVWGLVPHIDFLMALAVGACVTPTDPVLSNSIVKGKFADKNIPPPLQKIIVAESGTNDGLGYPFLYLALYLLKYTHDGGLGQSGGAGNAIRLWFAETWSYTILLSVVYGAVAGWIAKDLLHWAEKRQYVDRESFLVFAITLALFILGTCGMIGTDDLLACFIAGNTFTWDDWFRLETLDDSLQPTVDMLLNVAVFMWFGAVCPWHQFVANDVIPIYRLIPLGILVLLLRRLPMVMFLHKVTPSLVPQVEHGRQAFFTGFFGPIGVSAIFYLYIAREFLRDITVDGQQRPDAARTGDAINIVVWFMVICSIVAHGLSIPLAKLGFYLPRTLSTALSSERASRSVTMERRDPEPPYASFRRRRATSTESSPGKFQNDAPAIIYRSLQRFTRRVIDDIHRRDSSAADHADDHDEKESKSDSSAEEEKRHEQRKASISLPTNPRLIGRPIHPLMDRANTTNAGPSQAQGNPKTSAETVVATSNQLQLPPMARPVASSQRSIRFPDELPSPLPTVARPEFRLKEDV